MRTRLKSKIALLFIACATLLSVAGTAIAITADPSGSTAPAPTIQSDKADYAPGELVSLTGGNWQPGESVHIYVNDSDGQTWDYDADVTADESGNISHSFNLPDRFVANYSVKATGASGAVATTTFTDTENPVMNLTITPSPSTVGQEVEFKAFVDRPQGSTVIPFPTGTVDFSDQTPGAAPLPASCKDVPIIVFGPIGIAGTASCATSTLALGDHIIKAQYSGDDNYSARSTTFGHTVVAPTNTPPTISDIGNQTSTEDNAVSNVAFTVGDAQTAAGSLTLSGSSNNTTLVPNSNVTFGGSGANRTVTISPAPNQSGTATITVTVTDGGGLTASDTFTVTFTAVNDKPVIDLNGEGAGTGHSAAFTEDGGAVSIVDSGALTVTDVDNANLASATVKITNLQNGAAESLDANVGSTGIAKNYNSSTGVLTLNGPATLAQFQQVLRTVTYNNTSQNPNTTARSVDFVINDGAANSDAATSTVRVNPLDDPPLTVDDTKTVLEDAATATEIDVLANDTDVDGGPKTISSASDPANGTVVLTGGTAGARTGLTYQPDPNYCNNSPGTSLDTFIYTLNGGDTGDVAVTVTCVNDAPSFTKGPDQTVLEDSGTAGAHSVSGWATAISAGPADENGQQLTFELTNNTNSSLFSTQPSVSSTGTLTYTLASDANGEAMVTLRLNDDGGTDNGAVDTSATQTFKITVTSVNDAPSFTLPTNPNQTKVVNAGAQTVNNFATNFSPGPANESEQALLKYLVTNTNNSLFTSTGQPAIDANGTLTYTLAHDAIGTATVSVRAQDTGETANNGVDTSAAKTFTIDVDYGFSGFLQPINMTAHQTGIDVSTFKAGSTVPVKFKLTDAKGNIVQPASAPVWVTPLKGNATSQAVDEDIYGLAPTSGGTYRWDSTAQQWIYNWSTKGSSSGCYYRIGVQLDDGQTYYQNISLR